jgi:hypothetical protein
MVKPDPITLETVLALAKRLSAAEKLKLVEHLLVELKLIVEREAPKKRGSPLDMSEVQSPTEEEAEEIKRKLWENMESDGPCMSSRWKGFGKTSLLISAPTRSVRRAENCMSR